MQVDHACLGKINRMLDADDIADVQFLMVLPSQYHNLWLYGRSVRHSSACCGGTSGKKLSRSWKPMLPSSAGSIGARHLGFPSLKAARRHLSQSTAAKGLGSGFGFLVLI